MKKLILLTSLTVALFSCQKEQLDCNCGLIVSDNVTDYSITIRNECSGNLKTFYLYPGDWMNAHVGDYHCISNVTSW